MKMGTNAFAVGHDLRQLRAAIRVGARLAPRRPADLSLRRCSDSVSYQSDFDRADGPAGIRAVDPELPNHLLMSLHSTAWNGTRCFHRNLDRRTRTDASMVGEDFRILREIKVHSRCPIRYREEVRVRNCEILPHKVLVVREMPIEVRVTRFQPATKHFFGFF
jgi:hypothetical protein